MSTQVTHTSGPAPAPAAIEHAGYAKRPENPVQGEIPRVLEAYRAPSHAPAPDPAHFSLVDAWHLMALVLPRARPVPPSLADITVPDGIARDSRRRIAYRAGVLAASELGLDAAILHADELIALGRQTLADHILSGTWDDTLVAVARVEGRVDALAWAAGDKDAIAAQVAAFLATEFQDEIDLYEALDALADEPPPPGRRKLADELLRAHDIDPLSYLDSGDALYGQHRIVPATPQLIRNFRAGEWYFNNDKLTADGLRQMKTSSGGRLTAAHIQRVLSESPESLDAEFRKRFDAHQARMSALLPKWFSARVSLHARQQGIDLAGATVSVSRATMQRFTRVMGPRGAYVAEYSQSYGTMRSHGYLLSIQGTGGEHRCFVSNRDGAVHVIPASESVESWLLRQHELVFDDGAARARLDAAGGRWQASVAVQAAAAGPFATARAWLSDMFRAEIEQGREAARGQTASEEAVDTLLDLIPFRAMVVSARKGDISMAILHGGLDVLSLLPLVGTGMRLTGAVARSAAPWVSMGLRFGGAGGRRALGGLGRLGARAPALIDRVRGSLSRSAIQQWGRLRPLDTRRIASALRPSAPQLAAMLDGIAARAQGMVVPDGVWRVAKRAYFVADAGDAIAVVRPSIARNLQGGELQLLRYGEGAGVYTQIDSSGRRVGALLVADIEGWLHETMPAASLERYRVPADIASMLAGRLVGPDGTVVMNGVHYARLGPCYVEVERDMAVSTAARPISRVMAPQGISPDLVAHRLVYDTEQGFWRKAPSPGLAGGGAEMSLMSARGKARTIGTMPDLGMRVTPDGSCLARLSDVMVARLRNATPDREQAVRALLDRLSADERGAAILKAMSAHYELLDKAPEIVLVAGANAQAERPSLDNPVRKYTWSLDLDALRLAPTPEAVQELAAVYNNMTGLLQNDDPFHALVAHDQPSISATMEQAWTAWLAQDPQARRPLMGRASTPRQSAVQYLRSAVRETLCYGGMDRSSLKAVLRGPNVRPAIRYYLSHLGLDSIPPLPSDTTDLSVSGNPLADWSNLPGGLVMLGARSMGMTALPSNLPDTLLELSVSGNRLGAHRGALVFPPKLERLEISGNLLTSLSGLPDTLTELAASRNLFSLMPDLPAGLETLDLSHNALTRLSADLPATLLTLRVEHNQLQELPALPSLLEELFVSRNNLRVLPALPSTVNGIEAAWNALTELPDLPEELEVLIVDHNHLRRLPDGLPLSLARLSARHNELHGVPASLIRLDGCAVYLEGNPLGGGGIPAIPAGAAGPRIFVSSLSNPRTLARAVQSWRSAPSIEQERRWEVLGLELGARDDAMEFVSFLDRLRGTVSYRDPAFRVLVERWLVELSRPERRALLEETLVVCQGGTQTCEDRLVLTWNDAQALLVNDDVRAGLYDDRPDAVLDIARQMFRINVLTEIARAQERSRAVVDPVELYLIYLVALRGSLRLTTVAPAMVHYDLAFVTGRELQQARETVMARELEEFDMYLVLDYEPWQSFLKRKDPQAYADAEAEAQRLLATTFGQRLQNAVDRLGLAPANEGLLEDARKDLGPGVMRRIRHEAMHGLTNRYLA